MYIDVHFIYYLSSRILFFPHPHILNRIMLHVLYWTLDTAYFWRKSLKRKHSSLDANHNFSNFFYNNANLWLIVLAWNENLLHSSESLEWNHLLFGIAKWFRSENAVLLAFSTPLFSMLPWAFGFVTNNFQISFDMKFKISNVIWTQCRLKCN